MSKLKKNTKGSRLVVKRRNPEKVLMDKFYTPKKFKSRKHDLNARDADQAIKDYMRGIE
tara:strand:- start:2134 stop:2310 length:177 start_codon:yes stop_codon:yes gene_type:complete